MPEGHERTFATMQLAERLGLAGEADQAIAIASGLEENADGVVGIKVRSSALCVISQYLSSSGNIAKAKEAADRIPDKDQLGYALSAIAVAQVRQGDATAAMRTLESIEKPEGRLKALVGEFWSREHPGLAVARARAGDQAGAKECLDRARTIVSSLPAGAEQDQARASLALAEAQLGDVAAGLGQIKALRDPKTRNTALGQIALIQTDSGAWDEAFRTADAIPDPEQRSDALCAFGQAQIKAGKRDAARETFRKARAADTAPHALSNYHLALGQADAGDIAAALATVERMAVPDPQVIGAIVVAQAQAGDFAGARTTIAERIVDVQWKGNAYGGLAYLQAKAGQVEEALRWADSLDHRLHRSHALLGVAAALTERQGPKPDEAQPPSKKEGGDSQKEASQPKPGGGPDRPASIQGKTIEE
jgi:tetratricopeptide (TPR) repeat protein